MNSSEIKKIFAYLETQASAHGQNQDSVELSLLQGTVKDSTLLFKNDKNRKPLLRVRMEYSEHTSKENKYVFGCYLRSNIDGKCPVGLYKTDKTYSLTKRLYKINVARVTQHKKNHHILELEPTINKEGVSVFKVANAVYMPNLSNSDSEGDFDSDDSGDSDSGEVIEEDDEGGFEDDGFKNDEDCLKHDEEFEEDEVRPVRRTTPPKKLQKVIELSESSERSDEPDKSDMWNDYDRRVRQIQILKGEYQKFKEEKKRTTELAIQLFIEKDPEIYDMAVKEYVRTRVPELENDPEVVTMAATEYIRTHPDLEKEARAQLKEAKTVALQAYIEGEVKRIQDEIKQKYEKMDQEQQASCKEREDALNQKLVVQINQKYAKMEQEQQASFKEREDAFNQKLEILLLEQKKQASELLNKDSTFQQEMREQAIERLSETPDVKKVAMERALFKAERLQLLNPLPIIPKSKVERRKPFIIDLSKDDDEEEEIF